MTDSEYESSQSTSYTDTLSVGEGAQSNQRSFLESAAAYVHSLGIKRTTWSSGDESAEPAVRHVPVRPRSPDSDGRVVSIRITRPFAVRELRIAEFSLAVRGLNEAAGKAASSSSAGASPHLAVDGDSMTFSSTSSADIYPWWEVQLGAPINLAQAGAQLTFDFMPDPRNAAPAPPLAPFAIVTFYSSAREQVGILALDALRDDYCGGRDAVADDSERGAAALAACDSEHVVFNVPVSRSGLPASPPEPRYASSALSGGLFRFSTQWDSGLFRPIRYIRVTSASPGDILNIGEVEVMALPYVWSSELTNVALGKVASQSSTHDPEDGARYCGRGVALTGSAQLAVDGNTCTYSSTSDHLPPGDARSAAWWEVDLGAERFDIVEVRFHIRSDQSGTIWSYRTNGARVELMDEYRVTVAVETLPDNLWTLPVPFVFSVMKKGSAK